MVTSDDVLNFWLGPEPARDDPADEVKQAWWKKDPALDRRIRDTFGASIAAAGRGELETWAATPRGRVAVIILLDQFTRNVFRDSGQMYQYDERAVSHALAGIDAGEDTALRIAERVFLYMPLMHAEDQLLQERCVALFDALADRAAWCENSSQYAKAHRDIVVRFGRFPHRNRLLGRTSTEAEERFLQEPGSSF